MWEKDGEYNKWWYEAEKNFIKIIFKKDKRIDLGIKALQHFYRQKLWEKLKDK